MTKRHPHARGRAQQQQLLQALNGKRREFLIAEREVATLEARSHAGKLWLGFLQRMLDDEHMRLCVFGDPSQEIPGPDWPYGTSPLQHEEASEKA